MAYPISSTIENYLSWVILWWCVKHPEGVISGYPVNLEELLNTRLPKPILNICRKFDSGRKGLEQARAHGIGIHTRHEIIELGKSDLRILSDLLFDQLMIIGNDFTLLDVVAFAMLAQLQYICKGVEHPLRDAMNQPIMSFVVLVTCMPERAFPDWDEVVATPAAPKQSLNRATNKEIKGKGGTSLVNDYSLGYEPEKGKIEKKEAEPKTEPDEKNGKGVEKEK